MLCPPDLTSCWSPEGITGGATPASFEPSIDYVVTKVPRIAFEKFRNNFV